MKEEYKNTYGTWEITTEGDIEGRTTTHLGTFTGHIDELAFHLADKCTYSLQFKKVELPRIFNPKRDEVQISFAPESNYSTEASDGMLDIIEMFKDRPVSVEAGGYYKSIRLVNLNDDVGSEPMFTDSDQCGFKFNFNNGKTV